MASSSPNDPKAMIVYCLKRHRGTRFYTTRLGLPQLKSDGKRDAKPVFGGAARTQCTALYNLTSETVNTLADRYPTKEALSEAIEQSDPLSVGTNDPLSINNITEPLLRSVGPVIWSSSEPFFTCIHAPECPRHLKFHDKSDQERIKLYLFCWIIDRVGLKHKNRRPQKGATLRTCGSTSHDQDDDNETGSRNDPNEALIDTNERLETAMTDPPPDAQVRPADHRRRFRAPEAQMVPSRRITSSTITHSGSQSFAESSNSVVASRDEVEASGSGNEGSDYTPSRRSGTRPRVKRRHVSMPDQTPSKRIRATRSTMIQSQEPSEESRTSGAFDPEEEAGAKTYPSPPLLQEDRMTETSNTLNFPNVVQADRTRPHHSNEATDPDQRESEPITTDPDQRHGVGPDSTVNRHNSVAVALQSDRVRGNEDDTDSVLGVETPHEGARACKTPLSTDQRRRLVCIKLTAPTDDVEKDRQCLAPWLMAVLSDKLQQPDKQQLSATLELLKSLERKNRLYLLDNCSGNFADHKDSFERWLGCLDLLLQFYEATDYDGNLDTLGAFQESAPDAIPYAIKMMFLNDRKSLSKWRSERAISDDDFAGEVAFMLFHLASWGHFWRYQEIKKVTLAFTVELLAWFK